MLHGTGIFTYMNGLYKFIVNVGKYASPMDPMGYITPDSKKPLSFNHPKTLPKKPLNQTAS